MTHEIPTPPRAPRDETGLLQLVVRRPVAVFMVVLAVAVFGSVSLGKLPVNLLPDVSYPTLTVRTEYEGAAPSDVEKLVTRRLEENLAVISNLVGYRSISRAGVSDVILEFEWDTPMAFAVQNVREKVDQVVPRLPTDIERPLILRYDPSLDPILRIALFADDDDLFRLRQVADEEIRRKLENLPGVAAVRVRGGFEEEWTIELKEDLLKLHGVTSAQVIEKIALENANVAGGVLRDGDRESLVRTLGEFKEAHELERLAVASKNGSPVRVEDLGSVAVGHKERDVITRVRGLLKRTSTPAGDPTEGSATEDSAAKPVHASLRESVELEVFKEAGANVVDVANSIKTRIFGKDWRKQLQDGNYVPKTEGSKPSDGGHGGEKKNAQVFASEDRPLADVLLSEKVRTRVLSDQSVFIESSIREVRDSALIGAILAVAVLFAFLRRISPTLIISVAIPVSILATFAPLFVSGVSLNIMSLGGLALGVGMLVDSSIVVLESITRRRELGEDPVTAAVLGTKEVGLAVLASTLTTVAVFLPIVFVEGIAGEFFRDQALAVVFSLLASLLAALFFIPMLASRQWGISKDRATESPLEVLSSTAPWSFGSYWSLERVRRAKRFPVSAIPDLIVRLPLEFLLRTVLTITLPVIFVLGFALLWIVKGLSLLLSPLLWVFDRTYRGLETTYRGVLLGALRVRLLVLAAAVVLTWLAIQRFPSLGVELVPKVHQGEFSIETQLDPTSPVETTDRVTREIADTATRALEDAGISLAGISTSAGVARDVIAKAGDGNHTSRVHLRLAGAEDLAEREGRAIQAIRDAMTEITEARDPVFFRPSLFSSRRDIEVEVVGADLPVIQNAARLVEDELRALPELKNVKSTHRPGKAELVIRPNRDQLTFYSLTAGGMAQIIRDKVQGNVSTRVSRGDRKVDVLVRTPRDELDETSDILNLRVNPMSRRPVPLSAVATVDQLPGPAEIRRVGGQRAVVLSAEVEGLDLRGAARRIQHVVDDLQASHPEEFREAIVRIGGQQEESERSLDSLIFALLIATFLVYIVMASQFESLIHPLVILVTIPLALVGVIFALDWLDMKLSVVVLIGVILLVGIVVNNAIVLVDAVNQRRRSGVPRDQALVEAGSVRLRPILMTTLTTVLGLIPLALGLGEGAEIRTPMAITVIAGLSSSTVLTLVVIPVVYSLVSRRGPLAPPGDTA